MQISSTALARVFLDDVLVYLPGFLQILSTAHDASNLDHAASHPRPKHYISASFARPVVFGPLFFVFSSHADFPLQKNWPILCLDPEHCDSEEYAQKTQKLVVFRGAPFSSVESPSPPPPPSSPLIAPGLGGRGYHAAITRLSYAACP